MKLKEGTKFYCYKTRFDYDNNIVNTEGLEYTLINIDEEIVYMTNDIDATCDYFFYSITGRNGWYNFYEHFYNIKDVRKKKLKKLKIYERR